MTIFTDENGSSAVPSRLFTPNVSKCAESNQTYCTQNDNYPSKYISKLLKEYAHELDEDLFRSDDIVNDLGFRMDAVDDYLCESYETVIYPTSGTRKDGIESYIFNDEAQGIRQGVRVSKCENRGERCKMTDSFPIGYTTECKQQMFYRELISLSPEGKKEKQLFEFPACCSCAIRRE